MIEGSPLKRPRTAAAKQPANGQRNDATLASPKILKSQVLQEIKN